MIPEYMKRNFETIQQADDDGNLALLESHRIADGQPVYLICGINFDDSDNTYHIMPFAEMIDGDPFVLYEPPIADDEIGETSEDGDGSSGSMGDPPESIPS